ncbi:MAG: hypothetical protein EAZ97_12405 [Bacteroidetes bacterium]|nr:MAG: hypothetical protein EAZ97_12405 [Bacteroidota bacterium]
METLLLIVAILFLILGVVILFFSFSIKPAHIPLILIGFIYLLGGGFSLNLESWNPLIVAFSIAMIILKFFK